MIGGGSRPLIEAASKLCKSHPQRLGGKRRGFSGSLSPRMSPCGLVKWRRRNRSEIYTCAGFMSESSAATSITPAAQKSHPGVNPVPTHHGETQGPGRRPWLMVLRVICGNFLEMYDFFLFGFYARAIGNAFFPNTDESASLLLTFATFGAGFLMRPLGALVLGQYLDRVGRRQGLIVTLSIMALGTSLIAFVPGFNSIGLWAPLLVLLGRLLQGFSAGVELGGVSVYLAEMAPIEQKGFYVSWQSASQQVAIIFAAALGLTMQKLVGDAQVNEWAWRVPFWVGCLIIPVVFWLRASLPESRAFKQQSDHPSRREMLSTLWQQRRVVFLGMMLIVMTTVAFYTITVYTPTFAKSILKLSVEESFLVTLCVGLSNFFWLPVIGALSDRIGRWQIMAVFSGLTLLTAYPALSWLVVMPSFTRMLMVECWLSWLYAGYNAATVVALTDLVPIQVRTTGFSISYSLATALFGGFTPFIATWLIDQSHDKAAPGLWLALAGGLGLIATIVVRRPLGLAFKSE